MVQGLVSLAQGEECYPKKLDPPSCNISAPRPGGLPLAPNLPSSELSLAPNRSPIRDTKDLIRLVNRGRSNSEMEIQLLLSQSNGNYIPKKHRERKLDLPTGGDYNKALQEVQFPTRASKKT